MPGSFGFECKLVFRPCKAVLLSQTLDFYNLRITFLAFVLLLSLACAADTHSEYRNFKEAFPITYYFNSIVNILFIIGIIAYSANRIYKTQRAYLQKIALVFLSLFSLPLGFLHWVSLNSPLENEQSLYKLSYILYFFISVSTFTVHVYLPKSSSNPKGENKSSIPESQNLTQG